MKLTRQPKVTCMFSRLLTRAVQYRAREQAAERAQKHCKYWGILLFITMLLIACRAGEPRPVELLPEDMCAHCKMAISEKRFAAEFITKDGEAFKFDDIGCMANFVKAKASRETIAAFFVMDYETRQWLPGETANYFRSAEFKTPMNGGVAAFRDKVKADRPNWQALSFAEVMDGK